MTPDEKTMNASLENANTIARNAQHANVVAELARQAAATAVADKAREEERVQSLASQTEDERRLRGELRELDQYMRTHKDPEAASLAGEIMMRLRVLERVRLGLARDKVEAARKAAEVPSIALPTRFPSLEGIRMVVRVVQHDNPAFYALPVGGRSVTLPRIGFVDETTTPTATDFAAALDERRASLSHVALSDLDARQRRLVEVLDGPEMWDPRVVMGIAGVPITASSGAIICGAWLQSLQDTRLLVRWALTEEMGTEGAARFLPRSMRAGGTKPLAEALFDAASFVSENKPGALSVPSAVRFWEKFFEAAPPELEAAVPAEPTTRRRLSKGEAATRHDNEKAGAA